MKNEARSILSASHGHAPRVRALLESSQQAKARQGFVGFGTRRVGMEVVVRRGETALGDATNMLGGIADTLQQRRSNIDLAHLGELADAVLFDDDAQIREVRYREETGESGYTVRLWTL